MPVPPNTWRVVIEVRPIGSIGVFTEKTYQVRAEPSDLTRYVLEDVALDGLEPRNIISQKRLDRPQ
jgi:hypothetical protein